MHHQDFLYSDDVVQSRSKTMARAMAAPCAHCAAAKRI
jgi:hypothetical protein